MLLNPWSSNTGQATLTLNNVPAENQGTITAGGAAVTVATTVPGQNASLTFSGTQNQRVSLRVTGSTYPFPGGFNPAVTIKILKPDQTVLAQTTTTTSAAFIDVQTLPVTGTYRILVDPTGTGTGQATINLYDVPAVNQGTITAGGAAVTVTTTVPGQNASLTFSGTQNQRVSLNVTGSTYPFPGGFNPAVTIKILKPDQTVLAQTTTTTSTAFISAQTLPVTGTYTVLVDPTTTGTGQATLTLNNL